MGDVLRMFRGIVPQSHRAADEAAARQREAEALSKKLLGYDYTHELYGEATVASQYVDPDQIMQTPDKVAWDNGGYEVYDIMGASVPIYGALRDGRKDVATALAMNIEWLPGKKGDPASEKATQAVASAYENMLAAGDVELFAACDVFERGFQPMENVYDEHTRGAAKGWIGVVAMIDRPLDWFGFDYKNRPRFKASKYQHKPEVVDDYKVSFLRRGTLHSRYGRGYGRDAYPAVFAIDAHMKAIQRDAERFGYMPVVVKYPADWPEFGREYSRLKASIARQWKNFVLVPEDTGGRVQYEWPSAEAAFAGANATGAIRMRVVEKYEAWLSMLIQGSQYSAGNQAEGSYARDQVASSDRLWKAPSDTRCLEAWLNRHFVKPMMLVNQPALDPSLWPRATMDAAFGEDLKLLMEIFDQAAKLKIPISTVTWSEKFKLPLAQAGEPVLEAPQQPLQLQGQTPPQEGESAEMQFSEPDAIEITLTNGRTVTVSPDQMVYTENRGIIRAKLLQTGDVPTYRAISA
jgi:hypothetical protein